MCLVKSEAQKLLTGHKINKNYLIFFDYLLKQKYIK